MRLIQLNYFPVKSLAPLSPLSRVVDDFGFMGDRRWMLVDEMGKFVTQRAYPQLALLNVVEERDEHLIQFPDAKQYKISRENHCEEKEVTVWQDGVCAEIHQNELSQKLSSYLGFNCHLAYMPETTFRQVDTEYFSGEQRVGFADAFPFLLLNMKSLEELNRRLMTPVGMERFRGNLIIDGNEPYEEDSWKRIRVGEIEFDVVKPCSRCVMTTVDPKQGTKSKEPLSTLSTYRKNKFGVCFGQNLVHLNQGVLRVGDVVEILK